MKAIVEEDNIPEAVANRGGSRGWKEVTAEAHGGMKETWVLVTETAQWGFRAQSVSAHQLGFENQ